MEAKLDNSTINKKHEMANAYANEYIEKELIRITESLENSDDMELDKKVKEALKFEIGRILATSYAKGYDDCATKQEIKRLVIFN
mgnify:CR=1 FL=1